MKEKRYLCMGLLAILGAVEMLTASGMVAVSFNGRGIDPALVSIVAWALACLAGFFV